MYNVEKKAKHRKYILKLNKNIKQINTHRHVNVRLPFRDIEKKLILVEKHKPWQESTGVCCWIKMPTNILTCLYQEVKFMFSHLESRVILNALTNANDGREISSFRVISKMAFYGWSPSLGLRSHCCYCSRGKAQQLLERDQEPTKAALFPYWSCGLWSEPYSHNNMPSTVYIPFNVDTNWSAKCSL